MKIFILLIMYSFSAFAQEHDTMGCFDFSKPVKMPRPNGGNYFKTTLDIDWKRPPKECAPKISKHIDNLKEDYEEIEDKKDESIQAIKEQVRELIQKEASQEQINSALGFNLKTCEDQLLYQHLSGDEGEKIKKEFKEKVKKAQEIENQNEKKEALDYAAAYLFYTQDRSIMTPEDKKKIHKLTTLIGDRTSGLKMAGIERKRDDTTNNPYLKDLYKKMRNNIGKKYIQSSNSSDYTTEFSHKNPTGMKDNVVEYLLKTKNKQARQIMMSFSKNCEDQLEKSNPKIIDFENKLKSQGKIIAEAKKAKEQLCSGNPPNPCPAVKEDFIQNPTEDKFKQMIGLIDGVNYVEDGQNTFKPLSYEEYDQFMDKVRKKDYLINRRLKDNIKTSYQKTKDAIKNFEKNKEAAKNKTNTDNFLPIRSSCGGCRALKEAMKQAKSAKDTEKMKQIFKLDKSIGCAVIDQGESCSKAMKNLLAKRPFSRVDKVDEKNPLGHIFKKLEGNPSYYTDKTKEVLKSSFKIVDKDFQACQDCNVLKDKLNDVAKIRDGKYSAKDNASKDYFSSLKSIALDLNCMDPDDFEEDNAPSCDKFKTYFKDIVSNVDSLKELGDDAKKVYNDKLKQLREFEHKEGLSCCDQMLSYKVDLNKKQYISRKESNLDLAKAMQCLRCNDKIKPKTKAKLNMAEGAKIDCSYYKEKVQNKSGADKLDIMLSQNGGFYTVDDFYKYEVYTCHEGPRKSRIKNARIWETKAYSPHGKYGPLYDLNMKCFIDPDTGESVNLTCCNIAQGDQRLKDMQKEIFETPNFSQGDFSELELGKETIDKLNNELKNKNTETLCNRVKAGYQNLKQSEEVSSMGICYDHHDNLIYEVESYSIMETESGDHNSSVPTAIRN